MMSSALPVEQPRIDCMVNAPTDSTCMPLAYSVLDGRRTKNGMSEDMPFIQKESLLNDLNQRANKKPVSNQLTSFLDRDQNLI